LAVPTLAYAEDPPPSDVESRLRLLEKELAELKAKQAAAPGAPPAAPAEAPKKGWWEGITLNAFAAIGYQWNFNDPESGVTQFRSYDYDHNTFRLDGAELVLQKAAAEKGDFGFRLDVTMGAIARGSASRGLFKDYTTGLGLDIDVQQAIVSYIAPIGKGLRIDIGKFITTAGAEVIEGYDGFNDHISRSYLFTYGPFTHTGFKLSYQFHPAIAATVMLINGWDNVVDNNKAKSFGVQLAITPHEKFTWYVNYIAGPERDNENVDFRHLLDNVLIVKPHWRLTLMANVDFGFEQNGIATTMMAPDGSIIRADAKWLFANLYVRFLAHKKFALNARGELVWDPDGHRTGTAQTIGVFSFTPEFRATDALTFRAEFRYDQSDQHVFLINSTTLRRYQNTLGLQAIYVF
jgi:hypothetical protein